jgi:hypothetical protein
MWELVQNWATGGWMFVGGFIGAGYGTLRRWRDLLTTRVVQIVAGWMFAIFILFVLLSSVRLI